jgi:PAT family beta-lactamase induction signal transducer AmpG
LNEASEKPARSRLADWAWIPTLYFTSGLPYVSVATLSVVMYKNLGVSNEVVSRVTSDVLWPWVLKPLWSPLIELIGTQRRWVVAMQAVMAVAMFAAAWFVPTDSFLIGTLVCFWLIAIGSATHDIAADGFYMASMPNPRDQAWWVGIRNSFYRVSTIVGSGGLVFLVGELASGFKYSRDFARTTYGAGAEQSLAGWLGEFAREDAFSAAEAWNVVLSGVGVFLAAVAVYHAFALPRPARLTPKAKNVADAIATFQATFVTFFQKPGIGLALAYLLLYRISEAPLAKLKQPFLLDPREEGGLGLSNQQLGLLDGTIGVALLLVGGILGGMVVAKWGLRRWLVPMALAINLPNGLYVLLAFQQPESLFTIGAVVGFEQLMYGFGFAGYMLYMLQLARGEHQTAHYALCTGFMALGMMIPGRFAGKIQEMLGYEQFFVLVFALAIPSILITFFAPLREEPQEASTT